MAKSSAFFDRFPKITYDGKVARDLIARASIVNQIFSSPFNFFDYVIEDDMRPDQIALHYYDDPDLAWLVLLSNRIVDPYGEWPLSQHDFQEYIITKYGSLAAAKSSIIHYKHNTKGTIVSTDTYNLNGTFGKIEAADWSAQYAFEYEEELNDVKRSIKLLDRRYVGTVKQELTRIMRS